MPEKLLLVVDGLARKGFINRDYFKLTGLSMPSEKLRTFNRAVYELELAKVKLILTLLVMAMC
ncbi:hypothetical protein BJI45_00845 [Limosilactobacillus reuteri]|uniref:Transcriptional regulator n=1 Tax=Limosilactobacillus reuteri TaxID=1598 RepID=A0AB36I388_LIMRT|nr:hypothetical protein [Limosilactobacillus reuteri]OJI11621.1 hypothetical protein BJI45_00845 [Limosilactobacillus reuteri]